jgi:DNA (cytosine-5)-methyltransferase 1
MAPGGPRRHPRTRAEADSPASWTPPSRGDPSCGGAPCQPWSKSGQWASSAAAGWKDPRAATINAYLKLVEYALPRVVLLENVNGLASPKNLSRVRGRLTSINRRQGTDYKLSLLKLNAADYGVPQLRQRVFLIADRNGGTIKEPKRTHGEGCREPHRTAWDAISHLDRGGRPNGLAATDQWADFLPSIPEGSNYLAHASATADDVGYFGWRTKFWSFLLKLAKNKPAWTIQAVPGPATGPFHWRNRRLSIAELAALQTFPEVIARIEAERWPDVLAIFYACRAAAGSSPFTLPPPAQDVA